MIKQEWPVARPLVITALAASLAYNATALVGPLDWRVPLACLAGWYLADLASGIIHMAMDYWPCRPGAGLDRLYFYPGDRGSPEYQRLFAQIMKPLNPFERLVYDFKNHHPRPDALGRRSLWQQVGSTITVATLPVSLLVNLWVMIAPPPNWVMAGILALLLGGTFAQYFHGTLHRETNPAIVRIMRRVGLLMTPAAHDQHHQTLTRDFSTNCGWSNPVLNRMFRFALTRGYLSPEGLEPRR